MTSKTVTVDAVAGGEEVQPVATVAEVRVNGKRLYNTAYPSDALDKLPIGTALYLAPPTTELDALRKRVAELEKADETRVRDISRLTVERDTARDRVVELDKALEWALDNADTEHPHYPSRNSYGKWSFPYLVSGTPMGGGVGEAWFDTALEAVQDAARRVREEGKVE
jgi:hypothetical protein